ncbi:hypothetical protein LCGC14_2792000, partial [marine sediment metagenome]
IFTLRIGGDVADVDELQALAEAFDLKVDLKDPQAKAEDAKRLHLTYGLKSTEFILDEMRAWAGKLGKKLMVILFYADSEIPKFAEDNWRFDPSLVAYVDNSDVPYVDFLPKHAADLESFNMSAKEYCGRYYVRAAGAAVFGHYSPAGNFFTAMSIKDDIVNWLDPKPPAYRLLTPV